jgi:hypothetical protein
MSPIRGSHQAPYRGQTELLQYWSWTLPPSALSVVSGSQLGSYGSPHVLPASPRQVSSTLLSPALPRRFPGSPFKSHTLVVHEPLPRPHSSQGGQGATLSTLPLTCPPLPSNSWPLPQCSFSRHGTAHATFRDHHRQRLQAEHPHEC